MRIPSGPLNCASLQSVTNNLGNGKSTRVEMIAIYEVNQDGKIVRMFAYWDFDDLMQQMT